MHSFLYNLYQFVRQLLLFSEIEKIEIWVVALLLSLSNTKYRKIVGGVGLSLHSIYQRWFLFACGSSPLFCSRRLVYDVRLQVVFVDVIFWWQIWRQSFLFRYSIMWGMTNSFSRASPQNFHFSQADLRPLWSIFCDCF